MFLDTKKSELEEVLEDEKQTGISRRSFLKRSAYTAPVLMAMGQLAKPTSLHADGTGGPPPPPGDLGDGWTPGP